MAAAALLGVAAGLSLASGVSGFFTQRSAARAQKDAAKYEADLAVNRAIGLEQQANVEAAIGQRVAINQRRLGRYVRSSATARAAASGIDVSSPQVTNVLGDIDRESELRALTALYQGGKAQEAALYGAEVERSEAQNLRYKGRVAKKLGYAQANASLLRGGANAAMLGYAAYDAWPTAGADPIGTPLYQKYGASPATQRYA